MTTAMLALTDAERRRLDELEEQIAPLMSTFRQVGAALIEIRDGKLYREQYRTFQEYCAERWGMTGRNGYYKIAAIEALPALSGLPVQPTAESQLRPLEGEKDPTAIRAIWNNAVERKGGAVPTRDEVATERNRFYVTESRFDYVRDLMERGHITPETGVRLIAALDSAPDRTCERTLLTLQPRNPAVARELVYLYSNGRETFSELAVTGMLQWGDGMAMPIQVATMKELSAALREKRDEHIAESRAALDAERDVRSVSALLWINDPARTLEALRNALPERDIQALGELICGEPL